ncbi:RHS repeat-associated core domain-containing protein, partial [Massilia genomosp. 1]
AAPKRRSVVAVEAEAPNDVARFQPIRFLGQYHDTETGLNYNRFRYYDADCGRYVSLDPIGLAGGSNSYQYAPNPSGWTDPLGLSKTCSCSGTANMDRMQTQDIRFTQDTVSPNFSDGGTISEAVAALRSGRIKPDDFPAIRVVEKNGITYSLDNRRLATFSAAQVKSVPVQRLSLTNPEVMAEFLKKFKPIQGGKMIVVVPKAERAAARRVLNQFGKYD